VWGWAKHGVLGLGECDKQTSPVCVEVLDDKGIVRVSAGQWTSCAIDEGGRAFVWGRNDGTRVMC
jgi:alpha-tubulin suppressor-like RCC1 family protein